MTKVRFLKAGTTTASREHLRIPHGATHSNEFNFRNATKADPE
jgi:hypothetical protein